MTTPSYDPELWKETQWQGWDLAAPTYERYLVPNLGVLARRLAEAAALREGQQVLDVATGTGLMVRVAHSWVGVPGYVTGVDLSPKMLEVAEQQVDAATLRKNVTLRRMDAEELRFPDASFDVVLCQLGLMLFPNPNRALREMERVLVPGGRVAISVPGPQGQVHLLDLLAQQMDVHLGESASAAGPSLYGFSDPNRLGLAIQESGFQQIRAGQENIPISFSSAEECWQALVAVSGPRQLLLHQASEETQQTIRQEVLEAVRPFTRDRQITLRNQIVFATGVKAET